MTAPRCDVCTAPLAEEDAEWLCSCQSCANLHFCCVTCVLLWGRKLSLEERPLHNVWAEVEICPDDAKATAELMGLDLEMLAQLRRDYLNRGGTDRQYGSGLWDAMFGADWPAMAKGV